VASLGCGDPVELADLGPGQTVLDLGSGAGLDCLLAAERVGPSGKVIGLDMTREMIERATTAARDHGYDNVEFRLGKIEQMPLESESIDRVLSNCVINLSPEKDSVFAEAFRVLKPGGQLLVSDIVAEQMPQALRDNAAAWASCIAGAVSEQAYLDLVHAAGFQHVEVVDRTDWSQQHDGVEIRMASVYVRATKSVSNRKEESVMDHTVSGLDRETQLLVATGSAVAAGCVPCLQRIVDMARAEGIDQVKLKAAAITGQYVKEQPNNHMKALADDLLGTHLQTQSMASDGGCALSTGPKQETTPDHAEPCCESERGRCSCT
jgi:SAM-dependent methyltransferase